MFRLRQDLLEARETVFLTEKNFILSGRTDETKILLLDAQVLLTHLTAIQERCEHINRCTEGNIELTEMHFPGIEADCRKRYEQLVMEANGQIDGTIMETIASPGACEVLAHDGEMPEGYVYFNPLAHPRLEELWHLPKNEGST
jgi:hypothetical protein